MRHGCDVLVASVGGKVRVMMVVGASFFWPLNVLRSIPEHVEVVDCWGIAGAVRNVVA
jgi:hypothetical protein